jgi:alkanesulfonate monooxygenase
LTLPPSHVSCDKGISGLGTTHSKITMYSTCPQSKDVPRAEYAARVAEIARWSDEAGCRGMLVYTDNSIADPWMVAQHVIANTISLRPLVAVQPVYMHPYTAAKIVSSIALLHGRAVDLNFVAGGFRNDLRALADEMPHDERYDRVVEYATIVQKLLDGEAPVTFEGRFYRVANLRLKPELPPELRPGLLISGSSPAGRDAARAIDAIGIRYPQPPDQEDELDLANNLRHGIRVGIIAREDAADAWAVARARFPSSRQGEITHALAMKVTDSEWHKQLAGTPDGGEDALDPYWLEPFKSYGTFCPYLVGNYERVAQEVGRYLALGVQTIITDIPRELDDLHHARRVVHDAQTALAA